MSIATKKSELKRKLEIFSNGHLAQELQEHTEKEVQREKTFIQDTRDFSTTTQQTVQPTNIKTIQSTVLEDNPLVKRMQFESAFDKMKRAQTTFQTATKLFSKTVDTKISQQNSMNNINREETKSFIRVFRGNWNMRTALSNPKILFLFGDNFIRKGTKGQAIIRYAPNSAGIPTKKIPSMDVGSFLTDSEFENNKKKIEDAFRLIENRIGKELITQSSNSSDLTSRHSLFEAIMFPENGFGTGLAMLKEKAPQTAKWLDQRICLFVEKYEKNSSKRLPFIQQ